MLLPTVHINKSNSIRIQGITTETIKSLGSITSSLYPNNDQDISQSFQVVSTTFPITADGILGKDFLKNNGCSIDFRAMNFSIYKDNQPINLSLYQDTGIAHVNIPPRCEVFRSMNCGNITEDHVINKQEIVPGVFVAQGIVSNPTSTVRILNTNNYSVDIPSSHVLRSTPFSNFNVLRKPEAESSRTKDILDLLTPKFPAFAKKLSDRPLFHIF